MTDVKDIEQMCILVLSYAEPKGAVLCQHKPVRRLLGDERAEVSVYCLANWSLAKYQISVQSVDFPENGKDARTCARADVPTPWFMLTAKIVGL